MDKYIMECPLDTIISRIQSGTLDLQPNFQRGEVWSVTKQQKLIDSIFREWNIPPIHIVRYDRRNAEEVLDGQQRLLAIYNFYNNMFPIDGTIKPYNDTILTLDGLFFSDLPDEVKQSFLYYNIIIITITDFKPSEPAEIFERLNQPTHLTSAEQRNAYVGKTRNQIKYLVDSFIKAGASEKTIGFSNSRLAYDEIIAKFCYTIEIGTLRKKIIASDISDRYRNDDAFNDSTIQCCQDVLHRFMKIIFLCNQTIGFRLKVNKATIYSWFIYIRETPDLSDSDIASVMYSFELTRDFLKGKADYHNYSIISQYANFKSFFPALEPLITIFNQKASMGSTDPLSIIYRDIILYIYTQLLKGEKNMIIYDFEKTYEISNALKALEYIFKEYRWGEKF